MSIRISLSFKRAFRSIESILSVASAVLPLCLSGRHHSDGEELDTTRLNLPETNRLTTTLSSCLLKTFRTFQSAGASSLSSCIHMWFSISI
jgi:hypothetical protein